MDFREVALSTVVTDAKHVGGPEVVPGGSDTRMILGWWKRANPYIDSNTCLPLSSWRDIGEEDDDDDDDDEHLSEYVDEHEFP